MIKYIYKKVKGEQKAMREYVITVTFVDGQVMNRTTANQYFAQHLMKMFVKHDRVADVRMKIVREKRARQSQVDG